MAKKKPKKVYNVDEVLIVRKVGEYLDPSDPIVILTLDGVDNFIKELEKYWQNEGVQIFFVKRMNYKSFGDCVVIKYKSREYGVSEIAYGITKYKLNEIDWTRG